MTVREPPALVMANVGWHIGLGAARVHVYFDDPNDPAVDLVAGLPQVRVVRCDAAHWAALDHAAPDAVQTRRQSLNATHAYQTTDVDWLLHLDADEFVHTTRPLAKVLGRAAKRGHFLRLRTWERTYRTTPPLGLFDGAFRIPYAGKPRDDTDLFDHVTPFLTKGLTGHAAGKAMVPTGQDLRLGIHSPRDGARRMQGWAAPSVALLHFDGMTPLHWIVKILRYGAHSPGAVAKMLGGHRRAQVLTAMAECSDYEDLLAFHDLLKVTDSALAGRLRAAGMMSNRVFDPGPAIAQVFGASPDLGVAAFDAALGPVAERLLADWAAAKR